LRSEAERKPTAADIGLSRKVAAGVTVDTGKRDDEGEPILGPKYTGFHALRHWYASWCINRKADGGLELTAKAVQSRMGHSSIQVTFDTYGHLFPDRVPPSGVAG